MMREGRWLSPTYYYRRVTDIDLTYLEVSGIDTLLILSNAHHEPLPFVLDGPREREMMVKLVKFGAGAGD